MEMDTCGSGQAQQVAVCGPKLAFCTTNMDSVPEKTATPHDRHPSPNHNCFNTNDTHFSIPARDNSSGEVFT
ncbi:hypothetical protein E2C01_069422 [Portunus trituberculatus]|uniref:Uncharacterized protein n=1 Tax=Portunus trituberculatus TaxID=210409 RepID=A0A5B7I255_PORTR|nr:hypothetical protein [Portunus trituberculatus]